MHHEVRRKIGVASSAIALRGATQVKTSLSEKFVLKVEACLIGLLIFMGMQSSEKVGHGAGMEILADLEGNLHFFPEWRRDVIRDSIFGRIFCRKSLEIDLF